MRWTILALLAYSGLVLARNSSTKAEVEKPTKDKYPINDKNVEDALKAWNASYLELERAILASIPKGMKELPDEEPTKVGRSRQKRSDDSIGTEFHFYTRKAEPRKPLLKLPYHSVGNVNVNGFDKLPVRLIVHGFTENGEADWMLQMKDAFLNLEDCIVICVDWRKGAEGPNYFAAASNTRNVGKHIAQLLLSLKKEKGLKLSRTHIIGFSLGAQASGFAGKELNKASESVGRITGLDPAGPLFQEDDKTKRLDQTDAKYVDAIHTNGDSILGGLGLPRAVGHADFYPNGGALQPGCPFFHTVVLTKIVNLVLPSMKWYDPRNELEKGIACHHHRAFQLFINSISAQCNITSYPCDDYSKFLKGDCFVCAPGVSRIVPRTKKCGHMGFYSEATGARGSLYSITLRDSDSCVRQYRFEIGHALKEKRIRTRAHIQMAFTRDDGTIEDHQLTETTQDVLESGGVLSRVAAGPTYHKPPTEMSLTYQPFKYGEDLDQWDISRVEFTDSSGKSYSWCGLKTIKFLQLLKVPLSEGTCSNRGYGYLFP